MTHTTGSDGQKRAGEVRVRQGSAADVETAVQLFARLNAFERDWRVFEPAPDADQRARRRYAHLVASDTGILVLAEVDGLVVGLGVAELTRPSSYSNEVGVEFSNLYVDAAFRGRGLGRAIGRELVAFAAHRGVRSIALKVFSPNERAARFWTSLGFKPRLTQFTGLVSEVMAAAQSSTSSPSDSRRLQWPPGSRNPA